MTLAEKIQRWNAKPGRRFTFYQLARELGIPRSTCHRIATGQSQPSRATRAKLAAVGIKDGSR